MSSCDSSQISKVHHLQAVRIVPVIQKVKNAYPLLLIQGTMSKNILCMSTLPQCRIPEIVARQNKHRDHNGLMNALSKYA